MAQLFWTQLPLIQSMLWPALLHQVMTQTTITSHIRTWTANNFRIARQNEAARAADATREVVERWLPDG